VLDLDAFVGGDGDMSLIDPDIVYEDQVLPDHAGEVYRGAERMLHAAQTWLEPFEDATVELERVEEAGESIVSVHRFRGRFRHTGIELETELAWLLRMRDGRIVHWRAFTSEADALEAAGR
jgi:ketosteroid isomerase-like protein